MNNDLTPAEWGRLFTPPISELMAQRYCKAGRVAGAYMRGGMYWIPKSAPDPRRPIGGAGHLRTIRLRRLAEARVRREALRIEMNT